MDTTRYNKTLVSYVDTLGFSAMVERSRREATEIAKLSSRLAAMKRVAKENTEHRRASGERIEITFNSFSFSDLIVRCTAIEDEPPWFILLMGELQYLASRQATLAAAEGVFLRGGVTIGDVLADREENLVFGPALVRAYELEKKLAIYPRIVIDQELSSKATGAFKNMFENLIRHGEDGTFFLDYLCGILTVDLAPPMTSEARLRIVRGHREIIDRALREPAIRNDESLKRKYAWLALYHNAAVRTTEERLGAERFECVPELLVSEELL
jgi:hypothetical protein